MQKVVPTWWITIFIAGDYEQAKVHCRKYCHEIGLCVTVEPTTYIYTGGEEAGVRIGLINYPRFESLSGDLMSKAIHLAELLRTELCQDSYTIMDSNNTYWHSNRK